MGVLQALYNIQIAIEYGFGQLMLCLHALLVRYWEEKLLMIYAVYKIRHYLSLRWYQKMKDYSAKNVVIVGEVKGLTKALITRFASANAQIYVLCRDKRPAKQLREQLLRGNPQARLHAMQTDMSSMESVRRAAAELARQTDHVHVLVNNTTEYYGNRKLVITKEGFEQHLANNYLGPYLLIRLLYSETRTADAENARIISIGNTGSNRIWRSIKQNAEMESLSIPSESYSPKLAYDYSKMLLVPATTTLAERFANTGVTINCIDPGTMATEMFGSGKWETLMFSMKLIMFNWMTPDQAAQDILYVLDAEEVKRVTGYYWRYRQPEVYHREVLNQDLVAAIEQNTEKALAEWIKTNEELDDAGTKLQGVKPSHPVFDGYLRKRVI